MNAEEKLIFSRVSRRGFMGATAAATLAALAGREPRLVRAAEPSASADVAGLRPEKQPHESGNGQDGKGGQAPTGIRRPRPPGARQDGQGRDQGQE